MEDEGQGYNDCSEILLFYFLYQNKDSKKSPRIEPPPSRLKEIPSPPVPRAAVSRPNQPSPLPALQNRYKTA